MTPLPETHHSCVRALCAALLERHAVIEALGDRCPAGIRAQQEQDYARLLGLLEGRGAHV